MARTPEGEISFESTILGISTAAGVSLGVGGGEGAAAREAIGRIADRARALGARADADPREAVAALRRTIFGEEGFSYDPVPGNPENYLLDRVLSGRRGNCLGISALLMVVGERLGLPLFGVYVPGHCFVRYEKGPDRINMEPALAGGENCDAEYAAARRLALSGPYLRTLSKREMIGVFLKSLGAAYARKGRDLEAIGIYRGAAAFAPSLPEAHFNAGVSLQRMDRTDEAIAAYRRAIALNPGHAPSRDNLGVALAAKGRHVEALAEMSMAVELDPENAACRGNLAAALCACGRYAEGIREYRRALSGAPGDPRLLFGLARAYFAAGRMDEAAAECDLAEEVGCRFDPAMLSALAPYRGRRAQEVP